MPARLVDPGGVILVLRRLSGSILCLLLLACLIIHPFILFAMVVVNPETWAQVATTSTLVAIIRLYLPASSPTWSIFIFVDCLVRLHLAYLFAVYWVFWYDIWTGQTPTVSLIPFALGIPIGQFIALLTSYTVSLVIWRSKQVQVLVPETAEEAQWREDIERILRAEQAAQAAQRPTTPWQQSCFETQLSAAETAQAARAARDRELRGERERFWQEEKRRRLEEERRHHQEFSSPSALRAKAFSKWRKDCRRLLGKPGVVTNLPCPPYSSCPLGTCYNILSPISICSHGLRELYEDSRLEEWELKDELRFWDPDGVTVNRVADRSKAHVLGMANEIAHVLQEMLKDM